MGESADEIGGKFARGSGTVFVTTAITAVVGYLLRIVLARTLSASNYGLFFAVFSLLSLFTMLQHLGMNKALVKHVSGFKARGELDKVKTSIFSSLGLELLLTALLCGAFVLSSSWLAKSYFDTSQAKSIIVILSFWFAATGVLKWVNSLFQGFQDMLGRSVGQLSRMVITLALVLLFGFLFSSGIEIVGLSYGIGAGIAVAISYGVLRFRHHDSLRGMGKFDFSMGKKLLVFGLPIILTGVASTIMNRMDTIMLTAFRSLKDVGLYQVARPTTRFLSYFGTALGVPLLPMVSNYWAEGEKERIRSILRYLLKFSTILVLPVLLVFFAFPDTVIRVVFGSQYLAAQTALRVLSLGTFFFALQGIFASAITGMGDPKQNFKAMGSAAAVNLIANFLLIPAFGAGGAAIATSISYVLAFILSGYLARKILEFPVPTKSLFKAVIGGLVTLVLLALLKEFVTLTIWFELFVVLIPSILFYFFWVFLSKAITSKDLNLLENSMPVPRKMIEFLRELAEYGR